MSPSRKCGVRLNSREREQIGLEPEALLMRTAINLSIDAHRARVVHDEQVEWEEVILMADALPVQPAVRDRERLARLGQKLREIFLAYRVDGMAGKCVTKMSNWSAGFLFRRHIVHFVRQDQPDSACQNALTHLPVRQAVRSNPDVSLRTDAPVLRHCSQGLPRCERRRLCWALPLPVRPCQGTSDPRRHSAPNSLGRCRPRGAWWPRPPRRLAQWRDPTTWRRTVVLSSEGLPSHSCPHVFTLYQ